MRTGVKMTKITISKKRQDEIKKFLKSSRKANLVSTYLFYIGKKNKINPVVFPFGKVVYQDEDRAIELLEKEGKLWRETEIKIRFDKDGVNEETKKIYICPFTGKVFGDNTHPNPQDAIYDWVSKCPENKERVGGLKVKRFHVSEDPEVIKNYISKRKKSISKVVYSSAITGKLFNSKQAVINDFIKHYLKPITLLEVQNQDKFEIEDSFMELIQEHLDEDKITSFVEDLAKDEVFLPYINKWLEDDEE